MRTVFPLKDEVAHSVSHPRRGLNKKVSRNYFNSKLYQLYCSLALFKSHPSSKVLAKLVSKETNLTHKVPRLQFRMIDVVRTRQLVRKAVVIIEFNAHADCTAKVSRMKKFSKDNRADVHWLNEDTEKSSLNACQNKSTTKNCDQSLSAVGEVIEE